MKRALVIVLTVVGSMVATAGSALATDLPGVDDNNHSVCVVFSQNQRYNNTTYYCVSTPDLPPG